MLTERDPLLRGGNPTDVTDQDPALNGDDGSDGENAIVNDAELAEGLSEQQSKEQHGKE